jgi:hypothetical protein
MPRDHARVNLDIWGDDDFRELPWDAQALYWSLWTSPDLSYCGAHEWHPGRLAQRSGDLTSDRVCRAGAVLSERLFLIIEEATEECLLRSWIKHDGLWRTPNMAVAMAMARAALASRTLRGVVVHEVKKLVASNPDYSSWTRDQVAKMLTQNAIDPATLEPFNPGPKGGANPPVHPPVNPPVNPPSKGYGDPSVNPPVNPPATTATATSSFTTSTKGGYESAVVATGEPPPCSKHPEGTSTPCGVCKDRRIWVQRIAAEREADELRSRRLAREVADRCPDCEGTNVVEIGPNRVAKCEHPYAKDAG